MNIQIRVIGSIGFLGIVTIPTMEQAKDIVKNMAEEGFTTEIVECEETATEALMAIIEQEEALA